MCFVTIVFFFFKQKTAYEIGTGDWSSDVCSSDPVAVESGVYAIANLVELLTGGDPRKVLFDTKQMRQHLSRCFSSQKFESFPKQSSPVARTSDKDTYRAIEVNFTSQKY